jgi:hypothetical protein
MVGGVQRRGGARGDRGLGVGFSSWRLLVEEAPRDVADSVLRGGAPRRRSSTAHRCSSSMGQSESDDMVLCWGRKKGSLHSVVRSFYSRKRLWDVGGAAAALSVARGAAGEAMGAATWWRPLFEG